MTSLRVFGFKNRNFAGFSSGIEILTCGGQGYRIILVFDGSCANMPFAKKLEVTNFKHCGKIMDSVEHNGFVHEWKYFSKHRRSWKKEATWAIRQRLRAFWSVTANSKARRLLHV